MWSIGHLERFRCRRRVENVDCYHYSRLAFLDTERPDLVFFGFSYRLVLLHTSVVSSVSLSIERLYYDDDLNVDKKTPPTLLLVGSYQRKKTKGETMSESSRPIWTILVDRERERDTKREKPPRQFRTGSFLQTLRGATCRCDIWWTAFIMNVHQEPLRHPSTSWLQNSSFFYSTVVPI